MVRRRLVYWFRSAWPLAGVVATFVVGLAVDGVGGAVLAGALATLFFGPAYLVRNYLRQRRAVVVEPPPRSRIEEARSHWRYLRGMALFELVLSVGVVVVVSTGADIGPSGRAWTALLLIAAAMGVRSFPYLWALADWVAYKRTNRRAWAVTGSVDIAFGVGAAVIAATNQSTHWIGGTGWTVALAVLAALLLLGAPPFIRRALV